MRGYIVKRSKNSYSIKISLGKDPATGKYKSQWFTVTGSKKDAEKRLSELLHQMDTGNYMKPGKTTVSDYLNKWLSDYARPNLSPRTIEGYEHTIKHYIIPKLGNYLLVHLKPEHLQHFYSTELNAGLSAQTVRHHHMVVHKAFDSAVEWGLVIRNAADAVKPPKAQRVEMQTWGETEIVQFLEAAKDTPYYELFYLALFTGMRRSELLALHWQDIDFIYSQIYVSRSLHVLKGGKAIFRSPKTATGRRTIALSPSAILLLRDYRVKKEMESFLLGKPLSDDDLVFGILGKHLLPNTITHAWSKLVKHTGLKPIRFHDARHTHASIMLKQGIHPKIVQERLGHSSIQITLDTYSHVAPGLQEAAANRFDDVLKIKHNESIGKN
jgi:integrase